MWRITSPFVTACLAARHERQGPNLQAALPAPAAAPPASSAACTAAALGRALGSVLVHASTRATTACGQSSGTLQTDARQHWCVNYMHFFLASTDLSQATGLICMLKC